MFELKISAASPAELLTKLTQAVEGLSLTGLSSQEKVEATHKEAEKLVKENKEPVREEKEEKEEPKGRTSSRRNTKKEETDEEDEQKGRRSRTTEKRSLVADNEEQAALRAQLVTDLQDLADVEEAHVEIAEALKRVGGVKTVKEIASDSLGDFNEDIQKVINKYIKDTSDGVSEADKETLKTDLDDLQDILDDKNDKDAGDDVRDTLLDAWEAAGVKVDEKKPADTKYVRQINTKNFKAIRAVVDSLIAKYF